MNLIPIVTAVVYVGSEPWDGPKSLFEMMYIQDKRILAFQNRLFLIQQHIQNIVSGLHGGIINLYIGLPTLSDVWNGVNFIGGNPLAVMVFCRQENVKKW